jgi:hypothetical protein
MSLVDAIRNAAGAPGNIDIRPIASKPATTIVSRLLCAMPLGRNLTVEPERHQLLALSYPTRHGRFDGLDFAQLRL